MGPLQVIVDAFALGGVYVLVALGFVLVLNGIGAVNLAHGDLVTLGGFIAIAAATWVPMWPGIVFLPIIALVMAGVGAPPPPITPLPRPTAHPAEIPLAPLALRGIPPAPPTRPARFTPHPAPPLA